MKELAIGMTYFIEATVERCIKFHCFLSLMYFISLYQAQLIFISPPKEIRIQLRSKFQNQLLQFKMQFTITRSSLLVLLTSLSLAHSASWDLTFYGDEYYDGSLQDGFSDTVAWDCYNIDTGATLASASATGDIDDYPGFIIYGYTVTDCTGDAYDLYDVCTNLPQSITGDIEGSFLSFQVGST